MTAGLSCDRPTSAEPRSSAGWSTGSRPTPRTWDRADGYLFGPGLLVAPVLDPGATRRTVYLPEGATWIEVPTGQSLAGGQSVTVDAPLDAIPSFTRSDHVLELLRG